MFDPTLRCQNCGDTRRNHKGRACKGLSSQQGKTWTPWTMDEYVEAERKARATMAEAEAAHNGLRTLRSLYPHLSPWVLAIVDSTGAIVEVTSFPYLETDGVTRVMARTTITDPTTNIAFHAADLRPWNSQLMDMRSYTNGFTDGYQAAIQAVRAAREERGSLESKEKGSGPSPLR